MAELVATRRAVAAARLVAHRPAARRRARRDPPDRPRDVLPSPPEAFAEFEGRQAAVLGTRHARRAAGAGRLVSGSMISPETRARVRGLAVPIALAFGRLGLTPNALTLIGFGDRDPRRARGRRPELARSPASSSSSAACSTCSTARSPGRPGRRRRSARSWTRSSTAGARASSTSGSRGAASRPASARGVSSPPPRCVSAFMVSYARAKSEGLGFTPGKRHGQRRARAARGPDRHPDGRADPRPAILGGTSRRRRRPAAGGSSAGPRRSASA